VVLPGRRVYGAYSNVAWENVHPSIIALKEMSRHPMSRIEAPPPALDPCVLAGPPAIASTLLRRVIHARLTIGDHLISPMMGAYTLVTACGFNGIPPPTVAQTMVRRTVAADSRGAESPHRKPECTASRSREDLLNHEGIVSIYSSTNQEMLTSTWTTTTHLLSLPSKMSRSS